MGPSQKTSVRVRKPRSVWRDPRLIAGLALIALSIAGVTSLVSHARSGIQIYQVTQDLAAGQQLNASNTTVVNARPESDAYVRATEDVTHFVTVHPLRAGELLAQSSVSTHDDLNIRSIVITVDDGLPESVKPGHNLEIWFVPTDTPGSKEIPEAHKIDGNVSLVSVLGEKSTIAVSSGTRIEVRVHHTNMAELLKYTQAQGKLLAVPIGLQ